MDNVKNISEIKDNPKELEFFFRNDPNNFRKQFISLYQENKDSLILKVWYERLYFKQEGGKTKKVFNKNFLITILLCIAASIFINLPNLFNWISAGPYYAKYFTLIFFTPLIIQFFIRFSLFKNKFALFVIILFLTIFIYYIFVPITPIPDFRRYWFGYHNNINISLYIHFPVFLWTILGLIYLDRKSFSKIDRLRYIIYNGNCIMLTSLFLGGGIVFTFLLFSLFNMINLHIDNFHSVIDWVMCGIVSAPIIASYLVENMKKNFNVIMPIIYKIFSVLAIIGLVAFCIGAIVKYTSPEKYIFDGRNMLFMLNITLFIALGLIIFTLAYRNLSEKIAAFDLVTICLISVSIIVDLFILVVSFGNMVSMGIFPFRFDALVINLLILVNLVILLIKYIIQFKNNKEITPILEMVGSYLPVYLIYSFLAVIIFPIIGWFIN